MPVNYRPRYEFIEALQLAGADMSSQGLSLDLSVVGVYDALPQFALISPPCWGAEWGAWIDEGSAVGLFSGAAFRAAPDVGFWVTELHCTTNRGQWRISETNPGIAGAGTPPGFIAGPGASQAIGSSSSEPVDWGMLAAMEMGTVTVPITGPQFGAQRVNAADPPIFVPPNCWFSTFMTTAATNANIALRFAFAKPWGGA